MIASILVSALMLVVIAIVAGKLLARRDRGLLPEFVRDPSYVPVVLFVDERLSEDHPKLLLALENAIWFINGNVGLELFLTPNTFTPDSGEIVPVLAWEGERPNASCQGRTFAFTQLENGKPDAMYLIEDLIDELEEDVLQYALAHELGHILGLAHDDFTSSIMYHKVLLRTPELTNKDKETLRELYARE